MTFDEMVKRDNARRVKHVVNFTTAHNGSEPTLEEMNDMFGYTEEQHVELLRAARDGDEAKL